MGTSLFWDWAYTVLVLRLVASPPGLACGGGRKAVPGLQRRRGHVGGDASLEAITEAFRIILGEHTVTGVLVNIFGRETPVELEFAQVAQL